MTHPAHMSMILHGISTPNGPRQEPGNGMYPAGTQWLLSSLILPPQPPPEELAGLIRDRTWTFSHKHFTKKNSYNITKMKITISNCKPKKSQSGNVQRSALKTMPNHTCSQHYTVQECWDPQGNKKEVAARATSRKTASSCNTM